MQLIFDFSGSPEEYLSGAVHKRVRPPPVCPACQRTKRWEALGYYCRGLTAKGAAGVLSIIVRRFRCVECGITISLLPNFAQPYRLVRNETVQDFFDGETMTTDILRWDSLLRRYWRRFCGWFPDLLALTGIPNKRPPPTAGPGRFWSRFKKLWGPLALATAALVRGFCLTPFGSYRCHQVPER
jgi:hypothetical protein